LKISETDTKDMLEYIAGPEVLPLYKLLKGQTNVSEFKLAEDLKLEVNYVRNLLYRMYDYNLVFFTRKKDKIKGWYIYYWTFNEDRIIDVLIKIEKERIERLSSRVSQDEHNFFFMCQNRCVKLDFDQASDFEYRCPECGEILQQQDNSEAMLRIKLKVKEYEDKLNELENYKLDDMKKRAKEEARLQKIEDEKLLKEKEKKAQDKKDAKKASKKSVTKKIVKKSVPKKASKKSVTKKIVKKSVPKKASKKSVPKKASKKSVTKKIVKKSALKKASKKSATKKIVKKSAPKKASKKSVTKKVAPKKSVTKKIVKKSVSKKPIQKKQSLKKKILKRIFNRK